MGLFDDLFGNSKKKSRESFGLFSFLEEKHEENNNDNYELEDWQKEEVKKGNYALWNFEEEELEEDDYYYEDE